MTASVIRGGTISLSNPSAMMPTTRPKIVTETMMATIRKLCVWPVARPKINSPIPATIGPRDHRPDAVEASGPDRFDRKVLGHPLGDEH